MATKRILFNPDEYKFSDTSFSKLMQKRIRKVLIICSSYDYFMLEEDGRIDEQIFNEYASLNLRYPPIFIHADSHTRAFNILEEESIDLVIEMLSTGEVDTFELAKLIKLRYNEIPIVVLTHFSREVSLKLENEDLSAIDYVFSWLGNADLLLAIIKLIEDKMNAQHDVHEVGVQVILLVEDSIRYISTYLPVLYKIIFVQSREFMKEGLNEHQKMLRMRGRPKILLATDYEEAVELFHRYKENVLGVISDVSYKKNPVERDNKTKAGFRLAKLIKEEDKHLPILLQSSGIENQEFAKELNAGFIHKYSKNLSHEVKEYINRYFMFGEFIFRDPETLEEKCVATDLQSLQQIIMTIPDNVFLYHSERNDFTKWLNSRALFALARMFRSIRASDFANLDEARKYIYRAIANYRMSKGRGVIAQFDHERYDEFMLFTRIGDGSVGGKARGLAFINTLIKKYSLHNKFGDVMITIPRTIVLSTDIFERFMEANHLYQKALSNASDEEILNEFVNAPFPADLERDLKIIVKSFRKPIAVRSSSKLEDSHYQPFAGVYSTYMVPVYNDDPELSKQYLADAIKSVYASAYYKTSKAYMMVTSNVIDEEKMGIVLQEVCGSEIEGNFYPTISGVARSINFYPVEPETSTDGIAHIAYGLGKQIVEGGMSLRFSPKYPSKVLQLSLPEIALRDTQRHFFALNVSKGAFKPSIDDSINLVRQRIKNGEKDPAFKYVASTFDYQNNMIRDGFLHEGKRLVTFSHILNHNVVPLPEIIQTLLNIGQREMNNPIEIEFAMDLNPDNGELITFNFLQIRPIVQNDNSLKFRLDGIDEKDTIIYSKRALGNGVFHDLFDVVYVPPHKFKPEATSTIAEQVSKLNTQFMEEKRNFILIGPGRWGSTDPWLGVPVQWPQISQARIIVESGLKNYRIDPSQGTHFFQNMTSFRVGYLTINPYENDGFYDVDYLDKMPAVHEDEFIRHVRFDQAMQVQIDGKQNVGVIFKNNNQ